MPRYDEPMLIWIAIAFLIVAPAASATVAFLRGRTPVAQRQRVLRRGRDGARPGDERGRRSPRNDRPRSTANQERLAKANERLQVSLAELAVLRAAADETRAQFNRLRGLVPTK